MLTEQELLIRARDWAEVLWRVVPANALEASVRKAFSAHQSAFPLNAYDIKMGYDVIKTSRAFLDSSRTLTTDERVARCPNKANHLPDRFGEIEYYVPDLIDAIVPCGACRTQDFDAAKAELLGDRKEQSVDESLRLVNADG